MAGEARFQRSCYGGYRPVAADLVGFFRPHLRGCASEHYCTTAGKTLPVIVLGVLASVGTVEQQRVPLLRAVVRAEAGDTSEDDLQHRLLRTAQASLAGDEGLIADRGFSVAHMQAAGIDRFVVRGASKFTARRAARALSSRTT